MSNRTIIICFVAALVVLAGLFAYGMQGSPSSRPPGPQDAAMEKNPAASEQAKQDYPPPPAPENFRK